MARYTVTPYRISVYPHGSPSDERDVSDVLPGVTLVQAFASAAAAHQDGPYRSDDFDRTGRSIDFTSVAAARDCAYTVAEYGQSGLEGALLKGGSRIDITASDRTEISLRHLLVAWPGQRSGVLLAERAAGVGAMSLMGPLLKQSFSTQCRAAGLNLIMKIEPLVDAAKAAAAYQDFPVKQITLTRLDPETGRPARTSNLGALVSMILKPPHRHPWSLGQVGGLDANAVLATVSADARSGMSQGAGDLLSSDQPWTVALTFNRHGGGQSTVQLTSGHTPSMSFDIDRVGGERGRPTDAEFQSACQGVLTSLDLEGRGLSLPTDPWQTEDSGEAVLERVDSRLDA